MEKRNTDPAVVPNFGPESGMSSPLVTEKSTAVPAQAVEIVFEGRPTRPDLGPATEKTKTQVETTEREIDVNEKDPEEGHPNEKAKSQIRRSTAIMQYVSWSVMILFSLVFLGKQDLEYGDMSNQGQDSASRLPH